MNANAAPLSDAILSDLSTWHQMLAKGGTYPIDEMTPRIVIARAIEAIADTKAECAFVIAAAIEHLEQARPDDALAILRAVSERLSERPQGKVN
jgi:hypothetical protein